MLTANATLVAQFPSEVAMAVSSSPYLSLAELDSAITLHGTRAADPWKGGDVVIAHGTFDDGDETGPGAFVVIRSLAHHVYLLAPVGCVDPYWQHHLGGKPQVKARVLKHWKDKVPDEMELIRRWRLVGSSDSPPSRDDLTFLGEKEADAAVRQYGFLVDMVVADNQATQDGQSS